MIKKMQIFEFKTQFKMSRFTMAYNYESDEEAQLQEEYEIQCMENYPYSSDEEEECDFQYLKRHPTHATGIRNRASYPKPRTKNRSLPTTTKKGQTLRVIAKQAKKTKKD